MGARSRGPAAALISAAAVGGMVAGIAAAAGAPGIDVAKACIAQARVPIPPHDLRVEPGADAYTLVDDRRPTIVVGARALARWRCHVVLHELGHAFDLTHLTPTVRRELKLAVLGSREPWFGVGRSSPVEQFAELFYFCATRSELTRPIRLGRLLLQARTAAYGCILVRGAAKPAP